MMGVYRAPGEDEIIYEEEINPEPPLDPDDPGKDEDGSDYYIGFASGSSDDFRKLTDEQLFATVLDKDGLDVSDNPVYEGTWDNKTLFVILKRDVEVSEAKFTSIAGGGEQDLELNMNPSHPDIEIYGKTYTVFARRLGICNIGEDTYKLTFETRKR